MIIRERATDIVMITQHDHAEISGICAAQWNNNFFKGQSRRKSVEYAITEHDRGWINPDKAPIWNNKSNAPFSFMDYPTTGKLSLYETGIDEVESMDTYAALLCSEHYVRFTSRNPENIAKQFVRHEKDRQHRLKSMLGDFDQEAFQFHYDLLAFCDNLSLYACLNEPGTSKENEHRFFQKGFPIPDSFSFVSGDRLQAHWRNDQTIELAKFPFERPFEITMKQKVIPKESIAAQGILEAYNEAAFEYVPLIITKEGS